MNLREIRKASGYTQAKLAKALGVSRTTVTMWENGGSQPDHETLLNMSSLFNVSVDALLGAKNPPTSEDMSGLTPKQMKIIEMMEQMTPEQQDEMVRQAEYQLWQRQHQTGGQ
ncbi:MAG: helix-turn-helix domain-containing protein [Agathobaculum sp.]|uniref:helix-turn-helix transcriptional regulator n=1 Tax=Agathobaculum sp. TaxID=2048138 RepID=UPI0025BAEAD7|nr:helix-turn-helix transcriptional regulator [Agathobaculum sp.]MCI7125902.1 helix-turn-helix domain-containing protein [Agathobaculum sp.]MDY3710909.1 helix-turn-helix transcriptional regulator [Agathobaculum sp.]